MKGSQKFAPQAPLAIDPKAFGLMFEVDAPAPVDQRAGVAVVDVRGPLMHHAGYWFDSYEAIRGRVSEALAAGPKAVVLRLDSPGGLVSGMLETARALRQMAADAEIPLYAYVDGSALSAAYALACGCDRIYTSETGLLGSIGTLETLTDATAQAERWGLKHRLVASGARKTDGHPAVPISDDAVAHAQARVDSLAELFFEHVATARTGAGLDVDAVRALEAGIAHGAQAVSIGLADEVTSFDNLLASLASGNPEPANAGENDMTDEEQARKALKAILEDDDADEKAKGKARKALAAMDEDEKDEGEESKSKAESEEKDDEAKARAAAPAAQAAAPAPAPEASSDVAEMAAFVRAQMLDARPDLSPKMRALLEGEPLAKVKAYLEAHPKPKANTAAAVANAAPTRGAGQGAGAPVTEADRELAAQMDAAMGLTAMKPGVKREGTKLYLGVPVPETPTAG